VRFRLAAVSVGLVVVAAGASVASAAPPELPVYVWTGDQGVCFVISKQVPHCVPVNIVKGAPTTAGVANPVPPVSLPYRKGDQICYDPTPTSKGPCITVPQP
jgi:hypothetical protein